MNDRQAIIYGLTGQEVEFYPWREWPEGVPSAAATYSVWRGADGDDQDSVSGMSGTATMDTTSLALDDSAGPSQANRRKIPLASTTGAVIGRWYVLENAHGQRELVKVTKVVSADYVEVEHELVHEYVTTTSTLKGFRQVFTVDATWVATEDNLNNPRLPYRVRWAYTVASKARRGWTYIDLVRKAKGHSVSRAALLRDDPDLAHQMPRGEESIEDFIGAGWERLQNDLEMDGFHPNEITEGPMLDRLVKLSTRLVIAEDGIVPPARDPETVVRERFSAYRRDYDKATTGMRLKISQDRSGAITDDPDRETFFTS